MDAPVAGELQTIACRRTELNRTELTCHEFGSVRFGSVQFVDMYWA
jgi:hypothetical protein